ncbi:MAG: DUF47 family protein [Promethearchaeota archaeon]|nr:MAG: DUF47 family protein [Candidatus Lokiarchaeota archaeon]
MGTLLEWFRSRREAKIIRRIKEDAKKVYNCVVQFKEALMLFLNDDLKGAQAAARKVNRIENECDDIRREVMTELTKGELSPQVRNDMAHLINRLDHVADNANAAARRLVILKPGTLKEIADGLLEMVDKSIEAAEVLRNTIEIEIEGQTENVDHSIAKINYLEHEVDLAHYKVLEKLNQVDYKDISPFVALTVIQLIESIEEISDSCENTADFVKIINLQAVGKS